MSRNIEHILSSESDAGVLGDDEEEDEEEDEPDETWELVSTNGGCMVFLTATTAIKFMPWNPANVLTKPEFKPLLQKFLPTKVWKIGDQWIITAQPRLAPLPEEGVHGTWASQFELLQTCAEASFFYMDIKRANFVYAESAPSPSWAPKEIALSAAKKAAGDYEKKHPLKILRGVRAFYETDFGKPELIFEPKTTDVQQDGVFLIDLDAFRVPGATHYQLQLKTQMGRMSYWERFFAVGQAGDGTKLTGAVQVPTTMSEVYRVVQTCLRQHIAYYDNTFSNGDLNRAMTALRSSYARSRNVLRRYCCQRVGCGGWK